MVAALRSYFVMTLAAENAALKLGTHSILASDIIYEIGQIEFSTEQEPHVEE